MQGLVQTHFHCSHSFLSVLDSMPMMALAKLVDFECPRCATQSRVPAGLVDVDTHEPVPMSCPRCGLKLEFEIESSVN